VVLLLVAACVVAVAALAVTGPSPDLRSTRDEVLALDDLAFGVYRREYAQRRGVDHLEETLHREVLPLYRRARRKIDDLGDRAAADPVLALRLREFVEAREAAFAAQAEVLRAPGGRAVVAAKTRTEEADRLRWAIETHGLK
jgi:hypothetical protein